MDEAKTSSIKKRGLGRGLGALIPPVQSQEPHSRSFFSVGIEEIYPNPFQPRKQLKDATIEQLAESIKENGIIQPLIVRNTEKGYELIAGERRWRAAQKAGLTEVPVVVRDTVPSSQLALALIENLQRKDLNPLEEAEAYLRLIQEFGLSQEEVGKKVGRDRSSVSNVLRLLKLPPPVQELVLSGELSFGHAKCLLSLESAADQINMAREAVRRGYSVRDLEHTIKNISSKKRKGPFIAIVPEEEWLQDLIKRYQTKVRLKRRKKGGSLEIYFHSEEELIRIVDLLIKKGY
jgi:ParB family transcriptional regulator, chromosome partitioning protein